MCTMRPNSYKLKYVPTVCTVYIIVTAFNICTSGDNSYDHFLTNYQGRADHYWVPGSYTVLACKSKRYIEAWNGH